MVHAFLASITENGNGAPVAQRIKRTESPWLDGASIGELFRQLSSDSTHLIQQEVALAKAEFREAAGTAAKGATKVGLGAALALAGGLALTAGLIIALAMLIHSYWASALIVGVLLLGGAAVLAKNGVAQLRGGIIPRQTARTLEDDATWAKQEVAEVKRRITA